MECDYGGGHRPRRYIISARHGGMHELDGCLLALANGHQAPSPYPFASQAFARCPRLLESFRRCGRRHMASFFLPKALAFVARPTFGTLAPYRSGGSFVRRI